MIEEYGDIWTLSKDIPGSVVCVTTNGVVKSNGLAVMGRGIALQATKRCPEIQARLGDLLKFYGNRCFRISQRIWTFPTKRDWKDDSDLELIKESCLQLMYMLDKFGVEVCYLPRPGCANGHLQWADVKAVIEPLLDDRVHIVTYEEE